MPITVLQHAPVDALGILGPVLRAHAHTLDIRRLDLGQTVPVDFDNIDAVISLGGPMNVGDNTPWMQPELAFLRAAHERQLPLIGLCLGHQMIAAALGGEVGPMPTPEFGFAPLRLSVPGQTDTIFAGVAWECPVFHAHAQEVRKLPDGAVALASSAGCKVQAFRAGLRTYGFQFHFECGAQDIRGFAADPWGRSVMGQIGLSETALMDQARQHGAMMLRVGQRLAGNIAQYLFPVLQRTR